METIRLYILEGREIVESNVVDWAKWLKASATDRIVAKTTLETGVCVSTVFLGVDTNVSKGGPPLVFESMVFDGPRGGSARRYSTFDEAEKGHAALVAECSAPQRHGSRFEALDMDAAEAEPIQYKAPEIDL